ncbi:hypothetical protein [Alloscardovia macacae]|uniref:Uncharacterized protein n=1 Tax=Alloscardovia macacae TaxID=1160091 RepID=A0A261F211_9BIFI|nr:hypothetical protein [Alloscardovia macacae]OZG53105.1 hypothetical protein ALMA_1407 [Alloscardovia macacae]
MRAYGVRLDEDTIRDYGIRILADLAAGLPAGSILWMEMDTPAAWTVETYMMATLIDQMNALMYGLSDPKSRGSRPEPLPRPGTSPRSEARQAVTSEGRTVLTMSVEDFTTAHTYLTGQEDTDG